MSPYATHCGPLALAVSITDGPVLELGMGVFSTPILHEICGNRLLVSVDTSPDWIVKFARFQKDNHHIRHVRDFKKLYDSIGLEWAVAFVDFDPLENRVSEIRRLADTAGIIVVHDTEWEVLADECERFSSQLWFSHQRPWTTMVSNQIDLTEHLKALIQTETEHGSSGFRDSKYFVRCRKEDSKSVRVSDDRQGSVSSQQRVEDVNVENSGDLFVRRSAHRR